MGNRVGSEKPFKVLQVVDQLEREVKKVQWRVRAEKPPQFSFTISWVRANMSRPLDLSEFLASGLQARAETPGSELSSGRTEGVGLGSWLGAYHRDPDGNSKCHSDYGCASSLSHRQTPNSDSLPLTMLGTFLRGAKKNVQGRNIESSFSQMLIETRRRGLISNAASPMSSSHFHISLFHLHFPPSGWQC